MMNANDIELHLNNLVKNELKCVKNLQKAKKRRRVKERSSSSSGGGTEEEDDGARRSKREGKRRRGVEDDGAEKDGGKKSKRNKNESMVVDDETVEGSKDAGEESKLSEGVEDEEDGKKSKQRKRRVPPHRNVIDLLLESGTGSEPLCAVLYYLSGDDLRTLKCCSNRWSGPVSAKLEAMWSSAADRRVFAAQSWYRMDRWKYARPTTKKLFKFNDYPDYKKKYFQYAKADDRNYFCIFRDYDASKFVLKVIDRVTNDVSLTVDNIAGEYNGCYFDYNKDILLTANMKQRGFIPCVQLKAYDRRRAFSRIPIVNGVGETMDFEELDISGVNILADNRVLVGIPGGLIDEMRISTDAAGFKILYTTRITAFMRWRIFAHKMHFYSHGFVLADVTTKSQGPHMIEVWSMKTKTVKLSIQEPVANYQYVVDFCFPYLAVCLTNNSKKNPKKMQYGLGTIQIWDLSADHTREHRVIHSNERIYDLKLDSEILAVLSGSDGRQVQIWSLKDIEERRYPEPMRVVDTKAGYSRMQLQKSGILLTDFVSPVQFLKF